MDDPAICCPVVLNRPVSLSTFSSFGVWEANLLTGCQLPAAAVTNYHECRSLHNTDVLSYSTGGQKSRMSLTVLERRCGQVCVLSEGSRAESLLLPFSLWKLPAFHGSWPLPPSSKCITPTSATVVTWPFSGCVSLASLLSFFHVMDNCSEPFGNIRDYVSQDLYLNHICSPFAR